MSEAGAKAAIFARREPLVVREIGGEQLIVPIRRQPGQMKAIYALTGAASPIFELLDGERSLGEIRDTLVQRFEVSEEQAWTELCDFVEHLEESGLVERSR